MWWLVCCVGEERRAVLLNESAAPLYPGVRIVDVEVGCACFHSHLGPGSEVVKGHFTYQDCRVIDRTVRRHFHLAIAREMVIDDDDDCRHIIEQGLLRRPSLRFVRRT